MIKKLRTITLGTVAIAAVMLLFATGPEVAQVWTAKSKGSKGKVKKKSK